MLPDELQPCRSLTGRSYTKVGQAPRTRQTVEVIDRSTYATATTANSVSALAPILCTPLRNRIESSAATNFW